MEPIKLVKKHFDGNYTLMADGSVSNGHWALRKAAILNYPSVSSAEIAAEVFNLNARPDAQTTFEELASKDTLREWVAQPFVWDTNGKGVAARIFECNDEQTAIATKYLDIIGRNHAGAEMYASDRLGSFVDAPTVDASRFIVMSVRIPEFGTPK